MLLLRWEHQFSCVRGGHQEDMTASWTQAIKGSYAPTSPLDLGAYVLSPPHSHARSGIKDPALWEHVLLRPLGWCTSLNPGETSVETLKILVGRGGNLLILGPANTSLLWKSPWLIKPATYWSGVTGPFFLSLQAFCVYGARFALTPGELQRLKTHVLPAHLPLKELQFRNLQ